MKRTNNTKRNKKDNINKFWINILIFIIVITIVSVFLYDGHSLFFYLIPGKTLTLNVFNQKIFNDGVVFIPFFIVYYICLVFWIRKNIKKHRKVVYPIMNILLFLIVEFVYLAFIESHGIATPYGLACSWDHFILTEAYTAIPYSLFLNIILTILLVLIGYKADKK